MQRTTYFDLDDTFTPTQPFYETAKEEFAADSIALTGADMTVDDVVTLIDDEVDSALYDQHGVTVDRFKNALYTVAGIMLERTGTDPDGYDFDLPQEWGEHPISGYTPDEMMPGADAAIDHVATAGDGYELLTRGKPSVQQPKIDALTLEERMDGTHIVDDKGRWFTDNLVDAPDRAYLKVGNSVKSDIVPALDANEQLDGAMLVALHVPEDTWSGEETDTTLEADYAAAPWMRIPSLERFEEAYDAFVEYTETGDLDVLEQVRH